MFGFTVDDRVKIVWANTVHPTVPEYGTITHIADGFLHIRDDRDRSWMLNPDYIAAIRETDDYDEDKIPF